MQMLSMVRILGSNGYRVSVCCYYEHDARVVDEFRSAGAEVELLNLHRSSGKTNFEEMITLFRTLVAVFQPHKGSIVHVQYVAPGLIPILAARRSGVRTIFATIHYPRHALGMMELFFVRLAARMCNLFMCNSAATERSWFGTQKLYDASIGLNGRHCTIYNAVDEEKISSLSSSLDRKATRGELGIGQEKIIGVVGRLRSEKGHEFLFHAMVKVLHSFPSVRVFLVGDGPDKDRLHALAVDLGIDKSIIWAGAKTQEETFSLYGIMDVVVVPSQFEGFGLTAAEAMAAGIPVIASNVGGLPEVVEDQKTGLLVPPGDVEKLSASILELLTDPVKRTRLGLNGRLRARQLFSLEKFRTSMMSVYEHF
jgi:L-malate glycosyltransferase